MRRRPSRVLAIVAIVAVLLGVCLIASVTTNWHENPPRVKRPVVPADVLGTWQYTSDYPKQVITITVSADGTFHQTISDPASMTRSSAPKTQDGQWDLRDNYLNVHGILMKGHGNWAPEKQLDFWEIVESRQRPGQTAIFGGIYPDPDVFQEFTKVK